MVLAKITWYETADGGLWVIVTKFPNCFILIANIFFHSLLIVLFCFVISYHFVV